MYLEGLLLWQSHTFYNNYLPPTVACINCVTQNILLNPTALKTAKTLWNFGHS